MANRYLVRLGYKDDDEDQKTPSQKASIELKKKTSEPAEENRYLARIKSIKREPEVEQPKAVVEEPKKNFLQKAGESIKSGAQKVGDFAKQVFSKETGQAIKETASKTAEQFKGYISGENEKLRAYAGADQKLNPLEINDYSTIPLLQKAKMTNQKQLDDILKKPERSKLDEYRIKNISEREKEIDRLLNGSSEDRMKAKNFTNLLALERISANVTTSFLESSTSLSKIVSWKADVKGNEKLAESARTTTDKLSQWADAVRPEDQDMADAITGGFGSALFFFIPGVGVAKGASMLSKISPKIALLFGQSASSSLESSAEAGDVYETLIAEGKTKEEANTAANNTFWANVGLNIVLDRFGILSDGKKLRVLKTSASEGVQEMSQAVISNVNTGRPYDEGLIESGLVGAVTGGALGGVVSGDDLVGTNQEIQSQLSDPVLKKKIEEQKTEQQKVEEKAPLPESIKKEINPQTELNNISQEAGKFMSSKDFAESQGTTEDTQIGVVKSDEIVVRDPVDKTSPEYATLKADIEKNGIKEPLVVTVEDGKITTFEGSHRATIAQELGISVPVIVTKGQIDGFQTIKEFYESSKTIPKEFEVYRGSKGKVEKSTQKFDKVLEIKTNQYDLLKQLAKQGNEQAKEHIDSLPQGVKRVDFTIADPIIREAYKGQYDAIQYNNEQMKQIGKEWFDLKTNQFFAENEETAKQYASQNRGGKKIEKSKKEEKKTDTKKEAPVKETEKQRIQREQGLELKTEKDVKQAVINEARAYAERNKTFEEFADDINSLGSTIGTLEGGVNFNKKNAVVELDNGKKYTYSLEELFKEIKNKPEKKVIKVEQTFTRDKKAKLQQKTKDAILSGESPDQAVENINAFFSNEVSVPKTKEDSQRLKTIRAESRRTMFEMVGADTGNWKKDFAFFQTLKNNPDFEGMIDAIENGIQSIDEALAQSEFKPATAPSGYADVGGYADVQSTEKRLGAIKSIELPELVRIARQMTGMMPDIKNLRGRKGGKTLGLFYGINNGYIKLDPSIFRDPVLTAKVLAHEMGHMTDFFDDKTMARGNLIGRIASLKGFMRKTFTDFETETKISELISESKSLTADRRETEEGSSENKKLLKEIKKVNAKLKELRKKSTIKQEALYEELKALSQKWKPFDEEAVTPAYTKYRYSAPELYADAVSVLFNDPDLLKAEAPTFWKGFFDNLNRKPTASENFFAVWDLLNKGQGEILDQRAKDVRSMFDKGEDKVLAMMKEKQAREDDYAFKLKYELIDRNQALIDKVNELKKAGKPVSDDANPVYWLEEHNYVGGLVKQWVGKNIDPIYQELKENDLTWEDMGEILFHERVINERGAVKNVIGYIRENAIETYNAIKDELPKNIEELDTTKQLQILKDKFGDLKNENGQSFYDDIVGILPQGIANPLGFDSDSSKKQLEFLKKNLGNRWAVVEKLLPKYRSAIQEVLKEAEKEGFYKPDLIKQMRANPAYATFQVLEYMDLNIPSSIKQQVGTLKEVANPATSTIIKTVSTIKAIERNKVKKKVVEFLKENYPNEIIAAKTIFNGKSQVPIEPKDDKLSLFTTIEDGKLVGYYVDPYIASTMDNMSAGHANAVLSTLHFFNGKLFRPLFITFNLGFQSFNAVRDFTRFYKNTPGISMFGALKRYVEALPAAKARAFGLDNETISEMEKSKILGITYNDVVKGYSEEDKLIDAVIAKAGVSPLKTTKRNVFIRPAIAVLDFIEKTGNMIETIPKVAGYKELNGKLPPKELGNFIRTKIGSPDFMRKGAGYKWYNEVFLFSNAIKEGIRSDFQVATEPKTRGGYWFKTAKVTLLPKVIMFAALAGAFGDAIKKLMQNVSDYDLTNYIIIPMGEDSTGKTVYLRVPQDETGRLIGGLLWKGLRIATGKELKFEDVTDLASYAGGQVPSLSPVFQSIYAITSFAAGQNPYDFFRGRNVIPDAEFQAGGKYALKPYLIWQINQLGGGVFLKSYYSTQPAETKDWIQKTIELPVVSNILGRWIKVSDYGQSEANQKVVKEIETQSARERIEANKKINKAIDKYKSGDLSDERKSAIVKELVREIVGEPPYRDDRKTQVTNIVKKFKLGIIKGESDESINALIYANTNDEKKALLVKMEKEMSADEYRQFLGRLIDEKIISSVLAKELRRK